MGAWALALMLYDTGEPSSARAMWVRVLARWRYTLTARAMAKRFPVRPR